MKWTLFGLLPTFSSRLAGYLIEVWLSATRTHTFVLVKLHNTHTHEHQMQIHVLFLSCNTKLDILKNVQVALLLTSFETDT